MSYAKYTSVCLCRLDWMSVMSSTKWHGIGVCVLLLLLILLLLSHYCYFRSFSYAPMSCLVPSIVLLLAMDGGGGGGFSGGWRAHANPKRQRFRSAHQLRKAQTCHARQIERSSSGSSGTYKLQVMARLHGETSYLGNGTIVIQFIQPKNVDTQIEKQTEYNAESVPVLSYCYHHSALEVLIPLRTGGLIQRPMTFNLHTVDISFDGSDLNRHRYV